MCYDWDGSKDYDDGGFFRRETASHQYVPECDVCELPLDECHCRDEYEGGEIVELRAEER